MVWGCLGWFGVVWAPFYNGLGWFGKVWGGLGPFLYVLGVVWGGLGSFLHVVRWSGVVCGSELVWARPNML